MVQGLQVHELKEALEALEGFLQAGIWPAKTSAVFLSDH